VIYSGETVRFGAKSYDFSGNIRTDQDVDQCLLHIHTRFGTPVQQNVPMQFDLETLEFVAFWTADVADEYRVTVTVKAGSLSAIEQRVIRVEPLIAGMPREMRRVGLPA
jgi:hypothetical protein